MSSLKNTMRPYKHYSFGKMLKLKLFFSICKHKILVDNFFKIYQGTTYLLTSKGTNKLIGFLFGDILLGGTNLSELNKVAKSQADLGLTLINGYIREGLTKSEENETVIKEVVDAHIGKIDIAAKHSKDNFIGLKVSCFCNKESLKELNKIQKDLLIIERHIFEGESSIEKLKPCLVTSLKNDLDESKFNTLKGLVGTSKTPWTLNIYEFICSNQEEKIQKLLSVFKADLNQKLVDYTKVIDFRLTKVLSHAANKNVSVLMDAEETWFQRIIDAQTMHYFKIYNKSYCNLLHTIQFYLKEGPKELERFIKFIRDHDLKFGLKLVKGAYMKIETVTANYEKRESPVCNSLEDTQNNYHNAVDRVFQIVKPETEKV